MQKIATRIFIAASLAFGVTGVAHILLLPDKDSQMTSLNIVLMKLLFSLGFIILSSFALSVAGKYLSSKK